jgi:hypothetical protein
MDALAGGTKDDKADDAARRPRFDVRGDVGG